MLRCAMTFRRGRPVNLIEVHVRKGREEQTGVSSRTSRRGSLALGAIPVSRSLLTVGTGSQGTCCDTGRSTWPIGNARKEGCGHRRASAKRHGMTAGRRSSC